MLVEDNLFYADPSTFNDPLDCKPSIDVDLGKDELARLLRNLIGRRIRNELSRAQAKLLGSTKVMPAFADMRAMNEVNRILNELIFNSSQPESDLMEALKVKVLEELLSSYERGIVSFSRVPNCPLLWSHYGDQHKGICIGYSVPEGVRLDPVNYGGERRVKASLVARMLNGDEQAKEDVDKAVLLKKANSWKYEKESRLIGPLGLQSSRLELEEVIFGMRCSLSVKFAVIKALENRERRVKFYVIREKPDTFKLEKRAFNVDDMMAGLPNRAVSVLDDATIG